MKVVFTVSVRNSEWFWKNQELEEAGKGRAEWEALNEDKIEKHSPSWQYEIPFEVIEIAENRESTSSLNLSSESVKEPTLFELREVTEITFIGETQSLKSVVSNSLIHQYFAAKQRGFKYYVYIYLKENTFYHHFDESLIWISEAAKLEIETHF